MFFLRNRHLDLTQRAVQWPDALCVGLFTASSTHIAYGLGVPMFVAVLMGVVTAIFGGVLRDIACNDIPKVFKEHRPYTLCTFLGGWIYVLADTWGISTETSILISASIATSLRLLAMALDIRIPTWRQSERPAIKRGQNQKITSDRGISRRIKQVRCTRHGLDNFYSLQNLLPSASLQMKAWQMA
jgi:uncharacterized membrane protein YeiH